MSRSDGILTDVNLVDVCLKFVDYDTASIVCGEFFDIAIYLRKLKG
jgi:hypothetical protein